MNGTESAEIYQRLNRLEIDMARVKTDVQGYKEIINQELVAITRLVNETNCLIKDTSNVYLATAIQKHKDECEKERKTDNKEKSETSTKKKAFIFEIIKFAVSVITGGSILALLKILKVL